MSKHAGKLILGLLALAPALRLNVFSPYESFETRRFVFAMALTSLTALLLTRMLLRSSNRSASWAYGVAAVLMLCLFNWPAFTTVGEAAEPFVGGFLGLAVTPVAIAGALIVLAARLAEETGFHVLLFLVSVVIAGSQLVLVLQRPAAVAASVIPSYSEAVAVAERTPDVYLIVVDAYARSDVLASELDFDNRPFVDYLAQHGFTIPEKSRSNYDSTYASLSALFGMEYVLEPGAIQNDELATVRGLLRGEGPAVDIFKSAGYELVYVESPWGISVCGRSVDDCHPYWTIGKTAKWLAEFTIFAELTDIGSWTDSARYAPIQFDALQEIAETKAEAPRLIYAHVGIPHPPFLLDSQCYEWANPEPDEWRIARASDPYLGQLRCTNGLLEELIETIDSTSPDAVVLLTSDHGIALHDQFATQPEQWDNRFVEENMSILSAYRLPPTCRPPVDAEFDLVNGLRLIIDCLFETNLNTLPSRYFHVTAPDLEALEIVELTERFK